jgi:hypothetical protein
MLLNHDDSFLAPSRNEKASKAAPPRTSVAMNSKKASLDAPIDSSNLSTPKNGSVKNYGKVSEQIFKQQ